MTGGLNKISRELGIERIGTTHQAGSDSLVTQSVFFKLLKSMSKYWDQTGIKDPEQHFNKILYGLGKSHNDDRYINQYKSIVYDNPQNK